MQICCRPIERVRWAWQNFPATCFNVFLGHIGDMRAVVVVQQKNSVLPIRHFLLNSCLKSFHLLNIEFRVDGSVSLKQLVMDNPFPVPPYPQHLFTRMKIVFLARFRLFTGAKPFLALFHIDVLEPFFVASNDSVNKPLLVSIR